MTLSPWLRTSLALCMFAGQAALGQATPSAPTLPVALLVQSPADTRTDLQIFCLFRSAPAMHGSLVEMNGKLDGLLVLLQKPGLFSAELGETVLLAPALGALGAKRVLIVGLGDAATFTPERMYLVGKIALREADRLGVAHPFFAPAILDGGVSGFSTGAVAEQVVRGFRDALATQALLRAQGAAGPLAVEDFTFLAGEAHAADTQSGIDRALGRPSAAKQ